MLHEMSTCKLEVIYSFLISFFLGERFTLIKLQIICFVVFPKLLQVLFWKLHCFRSWRNTRPSSSSGSAKCGSCCALAHIGLICLGSTMPPRCRVQVSHRPHGSWADSQSLGTRLGWLFSFYDQVTLPPLNTTRNVIIPGYQATGDGEQNSVTGITGAKEQVQRVKD